MKSVLEELFYGNVCPNTDCRSKEKEVKELMGYIADHHDMFYSTPVFCRKRVCRDTMASDYLRKPLCLKILERMRRSCLALLALWMPIEIKAIKPMRTSAKNAAAAIDSTLISYSTTTV